MRSAEGETQAAPVNEGTPKRRNIMLRMFDRYRDYTDECLNRTRSMSLLDPTHAKESGKVLLAPLTCSIAEIRDSLRGCCRAKG